jgi:excisionase family DNA binding protein
MNDLKEVDRLAKAIANLATVIAELLDKKLEEKVPRGAPPRPEIVQDPIAAMLTKKEVAELLKVSPRTLSNLMSKGWLPYVKLGRGIRFFPNVVQNAVRRRQTVF